MNVKEMIYDKLQTIDIVEFLGYINEVEMGYINAITHPEDENVVLFNYTELATYEKRWNKFTMSARGLILDLTDVRNNGRIYVLAKPFGKFPNYSELPEYEEDIDFNEIEVITEKMDGSLGISYFFKDSLRFATRGSFTSDQAIKATEIWNKKYGIGAFETSAYVHFPYTLLVEIIYPSNRIVVDYKGMEDLVLLAVNDIYSDDLEPQFQPCEWSYTMVQHYANDLGMPVTPDYKSTIDELLFLKGELSANEEGFVVKFRNGKRLKIKGDEYVKVHKIMYGVSDKAKVEQWANGTFNDYVMMLPEEFRPELEKFADDLDRLKDTLYVMLQATFEFISDETTDQKSFALKVQEIIAKEFQGFMFEARKKGSVSVDSIRQYIYKNYRDYIEVIRLWNNNDSLCLSDWQEVGKQQ